MTTIYRPQRTNIAGMRARRIDRATPVIPAVEQDRADAAPAGSELHRILSEALASTGEATAGALRELRTAEAERARTARALEYGLHPMTLDEAERARLRAAYAAADAVVADKRGVLDHARTLSQAVKTVADALDSLDGRDHELASRLTATLALWQVASAGAVPRSGSRLRRV
jgi:vacuolar-type H+-ATPase subunit E/Vma4